MHDRSPRHPGQLLFYVFFPLGVATLVVAAAYARHLTIVPALPFVLRWTYLLYPAVSSKGFQVLGGCDCFSGLDNRTLCFLPADYSYGADGARSTASACSRGSQLFSTASAYRCSTRLYTLHAIRHGDGDALQVARHSFTRPSARLALVAARRGMARAAAHGRARAG